jgi:hypothetical protein
MVPLELDIALWPVPDVDTAAKTDPDHATEDQSRAEGVLLNVQVVPFGLVITRSVSPELATATYKLPDRVTDVQFLSGADTSVQLNASVLVITR